MVRPNRCGFDELRHGYGGITPQPATDGSAREDKTGQAIEIFAECKQAIGPHSNDRWHRGLDEHGIGVRSWSSSTLNASLCSKANRIPDPASW
jgi:hypothetical protein